MRIRATLTLALALAPALLLAACPSVQQTTDAAAPAQAMPAASGTSSPITDALASLDAKLKSPQVQTAIAEGCAALGAANVVAGLVPMPMAVQAAYNAIRIGGALACNAAPGGDLQAAAASAARAAVEIRTLVSGQVQTTAG